MFRKTLATIAAAAILATASLSATTQAQAGKKEVIAGAIIAGAIFGAAAASNNGYAVAYKSGRHGKRYERYERNHRKGWNKKRKTCELVPIYHYTKYDQKLIGYDKVCH